MLKSSVYICLCLIVSWLFVVEATLPPKIPFMLWPDPATGNQQVLLQQNGQVIIKKVIPFDVGKAGWSNLAQVTAAVSQTIASGQAVFM